MDYKELERLIDALKLAVENEDPQKGYWKALWALVNDIRTGLHQTRYPNLEEKRDAQSRLDELIAAAQARSALEKRGREEKQRAWEERKTKSQAALDRVESKVAGTRPMTELERMIGTLILAPLLMLEGMLRSVLGLEQLDEIHENIKACSANLRDAWSVFNDCKHDLLPGDRNTAYQQLNNAQKRLNDAWDNWRREKNRFHEEQRRAWEERQREREAKRNDFVQRVEANIDKLEDKIRKAEDALERQKAHRSNLEEQYTSAWSDSFKERCSDWISEADDRIKDIEDSIESMKGWLEEERAKLRR